MKCPVCKADPVQPPQCRRCRADLSLLAALDEQRTYLVRDVYRLVAQGRWQQAAVRAEQIDWLRRDEQSRQLCAAVHLLAGDPARAWKYYRSWQEASRTSSRPG